MARNKMTVIYSLLAIAFGISAFADMGKTKQALKIAWQGFLRLLLPFLEMMIIASIVLYFISPAFIAKYLGAEKILFATTVGGLLGSVTLLPGFVAYPITAIFLKNGASYMAGAAFMTTLMMVGVVTYPIEKEFFGKRVTVVRNIVSFFIAIIIAIFIGIFYGEIL